VGFTILAEAFGALLLYFCFKKAFPIPSALYYAVFHSISAFCNAGFCLFDESLCAFRKDFLLNFVITTLIVLGGIGFFVILDVLFGRKQNRRFSFHTKVTLSTTILLLLAGTVLFFILERNNTLWGLPLSSKMVASYFQSVTSRTAGFNTVNISDTTEATLLLLCILMFVGGSPGSCAGGIKTTTVCVLFALFYSIIKKREDVILAKKTIPADLVRKVIFIFLTSLLICIIASFLLLLTEGSTLMDTLFEVISAYGTVGLSTGLTPFLSAAGRLIIIATIFVGRLGPLALAFALTAKGIPSQYKYPQERVIIG
jgi:trk system potassium uptake protein TrkH